MCRWNHAPSFLKCGENAKYLYIQRRGGASSLFVSPTRRSCISPSSVYAKCASPLRGEMTPHCTTFGYEPLCRLVAPKLFSFAPLNCFPLPKSLPLISLVFAAHLLLFGLGVARRRENFLRERETWNFTKRETSYANAKLPCREEWW